RVALDPVSEPKTSRLPIDLSGVDLLFMNEREATVYLGWKHGAPAAELAWALRERGAASVVLTLGASGALAASDRCVQVPPFGAERVDATGAGDALIAGVLYATLRGDPLEAAARVGTLAAALTIGSVSSVRPDISAAVLEAARAT
ncbi:MAG: carbohydrate kinase family protein, partial [Vulcanimicrobiaceae bacterium]